MQEQFTSFSASLGVVWNDFFQWIYLTGIAGNLWNTGSRERVKENNVRALLDFPDGPVVNNLPANAEDEFNLCSGKIPHASKQLSPCATTTEPMLQNLFSTARESTAMTSLLTKMKSSPRLLELEKAFSQQQRPSAAKNKWIGNK